MSLVAYNASDESDGDESDGGSDSVVEPQKTPLGHISDDEEYEAVSSTSLSSTASAIMPPLLSHDKISTPTTTFRPSTLPNQGHTDSASVALLEDLPAPLSNVGASINTEDELEDAVKPKPAEIKNAQKPPNKKKQPVKITIPSLDETQVEEDENINKKPTASLTKSGLFSLLPPPIHSARKEINRPLIPHTLTKKPQGTPKPPSQTKSYNDTSKSNAPAKKSTNPHEKRKITLNVAMYGSDSDDADDDLGASNFFSLDSSFENSVKNSKSLQIEAVSSSQEISKSPLTAEAETRISDIDKEGESDSDVKGSIVEHREVVSGGSEPGAINDAPLDFGRVNNPTWSPLSSSLPSSSSQGYLGAVGLAGPVFLSQNYTPGSHVSPASAQYNMVNTEVAENGEQDAVTDDDLKQFLSEKEFQRLSGKRKRGLEEAINFVDANVDDYVDPSEVSKHLTEETEYVSHKNKDNMPTAQQRRKKQITYLAYQAKERELELKNTWAQNRMTKKQTQSKYGF